MLPDQINKIIDPGIHYDLSKYMLLSLDTMSKKSIENFFSSKTGSLESKKQEINELLNMAVVHKEISGSMMPVYTALRIWRLN